MVLLDAEEGGAGLLRGVPAQPLDAVLDLHERVDGLVLYVAEHDGEREPDAAREAGLLERDVARRVDARERVVLLEQEADRRQHGDAAVLDLRLAVERQAARVDVLGETERVEEAERAGAGPLLDGRGGQLRLGGRRRGRRDEGGGGAGGEGESELHCESFVCLRRS